MTTQVPLQRSGTYGFFTYGIYNDSLGHILVCDGNFIAVHLLYQNGQFLSLLLTPQQRVIGLSSVSVDN